MGNGYGDTSCLWSSHHLITRSVLSFPPDSHSAIMFKKFYSQKDREYRELMDQRIRSLDEALPIESKLSSLDVRKITSFGDAYSPEAYRLAHEVSVSPFLVLPPLILCSYANRLPKKSETDGESVTKMAKLMSEWRPRSEVWYHIFGPYVLSGVTAVTAVYITAHFRRFLRLDRYARYIMYSVSSAFPAVATGMFNVMFSNLYVARKGEKCRTCITVKNAIFQPIASVVYPSFFVTLTGFYYAHVYHTIPSVPPNFLSNREQFLHTWRLVQSIIERSNFGTILMALFLVNMFAAYYVSEKQQEQNYFVFKKVLDEKERIVQANRGAGVVDADIHRS